MIFGLCAGTELASDESASSYDYLECNIQGYLKPTEPEAEFMPVLDDMKNSRIPVLAANCLMPGDRLPITGPNADINSLREYVETVMRRAGTAGIRRIVFGSGGARRVPDGFNRDEARDQIVSFCRMMGPVAENHGVTVAVEPLNIKECNILNTVEECASVVTEVDHSGIRLLVDAYHHMMDSDSFESIVRHKDLLCHTHIATVPNRLPPSAETCSFERFFDALREAEYSGGMSIEGGISEHIDALPSALALMQSLDWKRRPSQ